jgi:Ni,Fe-hydrogenase I cytochrome b subunit
MHMIRLLVLAAGIILVLLASLKVYVAFHRANIAPELVTDATILTLGAIMCFALFAKLGKEKPK